MPDHHSLAVVVGEKLPRADPKEQRLVFDVLGMRPLAALLGNAGMHVDRVFVFMPVWQRVEPSDHVGREEGRTLHDAFLLLGREVACGIGLASIGPENGEATVSRTARKLRPAFRRHSEPSVFVIAAKRYDPCRHQLW